MVISNTGVEITNVDVDINNGVPIRVGESGQIITFNLRASSNPSGADVSGTNLWWVEVFTNTRSDGTGARYAETQASFPPSAGLGVNTPLFAGIEMALNNGEVQLDLSGVQSCASQVPYLCFTLSRNPLTSPVYTLTGFPDSSALMECIEVACIGEPSLICSAI